MISSKRDLYFCIFGLDHAFDVSMIARGRYLNRQKQLDDTKIPEE